MYDFAYTQAPASLEGVVMGLSLIAIGLGSYVASALVSIVNAASAPGQSQSHVILVTHRILQFLSIYKLLEDSSMGSQKISCIRTEQVFKM